MSSGLPGISNRNFSYPNKNVQTSQFLLTYGAQISWLQIHFPSYHSWGQHFQRNSRRKKGSTGVTPVFGSINSQFNSPILLRSPQLDPPRGSIRSPYQPIHRHRVNGWPQPWAWGIRNRLLFRLWHPHDSHLRGCDVPRRELFPNLPLT